MRPCNSCRHNRSVAAVRSPHSHIPASQLSPCTNPLSTRERQVASAQHEHGSSRMAERAVINNRGHELPNPNIFIIMCDSAEAVNKKSQRRSCSLPTYPYPSIAALAMHESTIHPRASSSFCTARAWRLSYGRAGSDSRPSMLEHKIQK